MTVHIIAHTHDDVGWIRTVDEYFTGNEPNVALILDSVITELLKDPNRTFTYVEMKYFTMWYYEQD
jgi:hypothetical protein